MYQGKYIFAQIVDVISRYQFNQCVDRYQGAHRVQQLTCWEQFLALTFGHLSCRNSLRDIVMCLTAHHEKLYHLGLRSLVRKSTLADANEHRDWRMYQELAGVLIAQARQLYTNDRLEDLDIVAPIYAIDATIITLCLSLFPWARLPHDHAAIKVSIGLELHGHIPAFFGFSGRTSPDVFFLDLVTYEVGAYYVFDRGYLDFGRFYAIHQAGAFFMTRAKVTWSFRRLYSRKVDKTTGIRCDQVVVQGHHHHVKNYPDQMRRIKYYDHTTDLYYVFVTNNFTLPATTIAALYKQRWQIELFFKWLKQHLKIESLWGRSMNAVQTQICIALSSYLLVVILKKRVRSKLSTYEILQILSVSLFDKIPIDELISKHRPATLQTPVQKQASLLEF